MIDQPGGSRFNTLAIHAGNPPGPVAPAAGSALSGGDRLHDAGGAQASAALRIFDGGLVPGAATTQGLLEERVAALEGGSAALALASGQAARLIACRTLMQPGDEIVAARPPWGRASFAQSFESFGWYTRWADPDSPESFVEALSDRTKAILIESIASPGGVLTDIEAIARAAQGARIPLVVDNSLATPVLVRPLDHGADIVLYADTGFLAGAGSTAGLIIDGGTFDWSRDERYPALSQVHPDHEGAVLGEVFGNFAFAVACRVLAHRDFGPAMLPRDAAATAHGIETLPLRMQRHCENALAVAQYLAGHRAVSRVRYAGGVADSGHALMQRYGSGGAGAMFTFALVGGCEACTRLVARLKLFSPLIVIGDTRSGIAHPASTLGREAAIPPDVVQVSIGLEDCNDIIADLDQALAG